MGWDGDDRDPGYRQLVTKIASCLRPNALGPTARADEIFFGTKRLDLPAFMYSVSSYETQVAPADGAALLRELSAPTALISAYDLWKSQTRRRLHTEAKRLLDSDSVLFLDSGNYEAYRKKDRYSRANPDGWRKKYFREIVQHVSPDAAFSFDSLWRDGSVTDLAARTGRNFRSDLRAIDAANVALCPIIHLPRRIDGSRAEFAADLVCEVAHELDPIMVAIPERELGAGIRARARTVRGIRKKLDTLGRYCPLHLLGTGNPVSIVVMAVAGADSFDGLEWCRTAANYESGHLFHFQQFDLFLEACLPRVRDAKTRVLLDDPDVPYTVKVLSYNVDFFNDWSQTMRRLIHTGNGEMLLRTVVPNIGPQLAEELSQ